MLITSIKSFIVLLLFCVFALTNKTDAIQQLLRSDVTMSRPVLSTHVLDTSTGKPAAGLFIDLHKKNDSSWTLWHNTMTTTDGRALFPFSQESMGEGTYKLTFKVGDYYKMSDKETLYPQVEITFNTKDGQHYHIPLLLSPYGYTTYRGS